MDKTEGTLCYTPERVCRLVVATMVLHNFCIDHKLQWQIDTIAQEDTFAEDIIAEDTIAEDTIAEGSFPGATTNASIDRQSVITNYFD